MKFSVPPIRIAGGLIVSILALTCCSIVTTQVKLGPAKPVDEATLRGLIDADDADVSARIRTASR
jgi:hypothetical protein